MPRTRSAPVVIPPRTRSTARETHPKKLTRWNDSFFVLAYEFARQGGSDNAIATGLGVDRNVLAAWKKKRPALREAIERGRNIRQANNAASFPQFIAGRLPLELKPLWNRIHKADRKRNAITRIEAILADQGKQSRQRIFLHALYCNSFSITRACQLSGISRKMFNEWALNDPQFHYLFEEMEETKRDFFETALVHSVARGDTPAVIFANKTYNAKRGYGDKLQVDVSGDIRMEHDLVDIEQLELPLEVLRMILRQSERVPVERVPVAGAALPTELVLEQTDD